MTDFINAINGPIAINDLNKTLMHEHLALGLAAWESDTLADNGTRRDVVARCVDIIQELQGSGYSTLLDPCPNDIGRDIELMGEVSARTGFNILFAVGLYDERLAGTYWKFKAERDPDAEQYIADMYIREIERGVRDTGCKPAVIKVATGLAPFSHFESVAMAAAARASVATGVPITTHTYGADGEKQLAYLTDRGVSSDRIIIGHSCGSNDGQYHRTICDGGAYIGFDRFGLAHHNSDENRISSLLSLISDGYTDQVIISHDCVMNYRASHVGRGRNPPTISPLHFSKVIAPKLLSSGLAEATLDALLIDNPRRYFRG